MTLRRTCICLFWTSFALAACDRGTGVRTLVLTDSSLPGSGMTREYLLPYLDHFGIVYETADLAESDPGMNPPDCALIIAGQDFQDDERVEKIVMRYRASGAGVVSFDPDLLSSAGESAPADVITISGQHYITALHDTFDTIRCFSPMNIRACTVPGGEVLVSASGIPLLVASEYDGMKLACFTSMDWMRSEVLGPLMGLDDCLWRAMVWAARKPFAMRGLPPLVTMRVDDVMGTGRLWDRSPFYWVRLANDYGFKPWLGLFIYNLDPDAIDELRTLLIGGQATASPHAFGSPNRTGIGTLEEASRQAEEEGYYRGFYYYPEGLPPRSADYDEFIYFDHHHKRPWSDAEAERGLEAVDRWYEEHRPLPKSEYFLAHWYEMGSNVIGHVSGDWGMEFIGMNKEIDRPWADSIPWIRGRPFRVYETPRTSTNSTDFGGTNPVYYADFVTVGGKGFFNCFTEVRDETGYEWYPDKDVVPSARRGIRQLRRALSSMAMAVLFTHENGTLYAIEPSVLDAQFRLIRQGIADFSPMLVTTDDAVRIVRAHRTSSLTGCSMSTGHSLTLDFSGEADTVSYAYYFTEQEGRIVQAMTDIPPFRGKLRLTVDDL